MPFITDALTWEHRCFNSWFKRLPGLIGSIDLPRVTGLTECLEKLLLSHAAAEDDLLLLAIAQTADKRIWKRFRREHQEIDSKLTQIYRAKTPQEASHLMVQVVTYSERHFAHEEEVVFPWVESKLPRQTLTRLGRLWLLQRHHGGFRLNLKELNLGPKVIGYELKELPLKLPIRSKEPARQPKAD